MPIVIDFVNLRVASDKARYLVSVLICLLVGAAVEYLSGNVDMQDVLTSAGIVFVTAQSIYRLYWKDSQERKATLDAVKNLGK